MAANANDQNRRTAILGELFIDLSSKTVEVDGDPVKLTWKELQILELLAHRKGEVVTKAVFLSHLYGGKDEPALKIIDVFICKLRKKLAARGSGHSFIETVWGRGYTLREHHKAKSATISLYTGCTSQPSFKIPSPKFAGCNAADPHRAVNGPSVGA